MSREVPNKIAITPASQAELMSDGKALRTVDALHKVAQSAVTVELVCCVSCLHTDEDLQTIVGLFWGEEENLSQTQGLNTTSSSHHITSHSRWSALHAGAFFSFMLITEGLNQKFSHLNTVKTIWLHLNELLFIVFYVMFCLAR